MLENLCVPNRWLDLVRKCDWSSLQTQATSVDMITSVPDSAGGRGLRYGIDRLNKLLGQKGMPKFPSSVRCPADVQVWSLGGSSDLWYTTFATTLVQETLGVIAQWK